MVSSCGATVCSTSEQKQTLSLSREKLQSLIYLLFIPPQLPTLLSTELSLVHYFFPRSQQSYQSSSHFIMKYCFASAKFSKECSCMHATQTRVINQNLGSTFKLKCREVSFFSSDRCSSHSAFKCNPSGVL